MLRLETRDEMELFGYAALRVAYVASPSVGPMATIPFARESVFVYLM